MNIEEFGNSIKQKYGDATTADGRRYVDIPNQELTNMVVKKYPVYASQISDFSRLTTQPSAPLTSMEELFRSGQTDKTYISPQETLAKWATEGTPKAEAPFKVGEKETSLSVASKTIGNIPTSAMNFATGIVDFLNPIRAGKSLYDTYKMAEEYGKETDQSALSVIWKSLNQPVSGKPGEPTDVGKALIPEAFQSLAQGDMEGFMKANVEDPFGTWGVLLLLSKSIAEKSGMGKQFDQAITRVTEPVIETAKIPSKIGEVVKTEVPQIISNIRSKVTKLNPQVETILKETPMKKFESYVAQAEKAKLDPREITPLEASGQKAKAVLSYLDEIRNEVGQNKRDITKAMGKLDATQAVSEARSGLRSDAPSMGITLKADGTIRTAPGRLPKTVSKADLKLLTDTDAILAKAEKKGNLQAVDDAIDSIQEMIYKRKATVGAEPLSKEIDGIVSRRIGELNEKLKDIGGEDYRATNEYYSKILKLRNDLSKSLGKDTKSAGAFMKRLFSPSDANTKKLFADIKTETGVDLAQDATLAKFVMETIGDIRQKSLLEELPTSKTGLATQTLNWIKGKIGLEPFEQARRLIESSEKKSFTDEGLLERILPEYLKSYLEEPKAGGSIKDVSEPSLKQGEIPSTKLPVFEGYKDITTKTLDYLKGKDEVSRQYISDLTNMPEMKQVERNLVRQTLETFKGDKIPVQEFADKVKIELLQLKLTEPKLATGITNRYENTSLPDELRGNVANYAEHIWESPIKTSAGGVHFNAERTPNYFGHTRIEDMASTGKKSDLNAKISGEPRVRRVIEVQSDLYQKGNLENELIPVSKINAWKEPVKEIILDNGEQISFVPDNVRGGMDVIRWGKDGKQIEQLRGQKTNEVIDYIKKYKPDYKPPVTDKSKLQQYNDPTAHFRMVREEVKQAAIDGKTKLQFPTGETIMKIEGLGDMSSWYKIVKPSTNLVNFERQPLTIQNLKIGSTIRNSGVNTNWIITDVLGDGKFKAVPKDSWDIAYSQPTNYLKGVRQHLEQVKRNVQSQIEQFDISGKVDTNNPIYRFYEKVLGRYLKNKYGAEMIIDKQGVNWWEIDIKPEMKIDPIDAFSMKSLQRILA